VNCITTVKFTLNNKEPSGMLSHNYNTVAGTGSIPVSTVCFTEIGQVFQMTQKYQKGDLKDKKIQNIF